MIYLALGANLDSDIGTPIDTLIAACKSLEENNISIVNKSSIWLTAPVPFDADQNWYHNAVIAVQTDLTPSTLLSVLLDIEQNLGRVRDGNRNAARVIDLDIIAYYDMILHEEGLSIPHPRMHERLFVLNPLSEIAEQWVHPELRKTIPQMTAKIPADQQAKKLEGAW